MPAKHAIIIGFLVQDAATIPLACADTNLAWIVPLLALTFHGGIANLVGITLGTPIMSAVRGGRPGVKLLPGIQKATWVDGLLCVVAAVIVAAALRLPDRLRHRAASTARVTAA